MLDRIAQIVLIIFGALLLALLVLGLAISCRPLAAGDPAGETATALASTPGIVTPNIPPLTLIPTPIVAASATPLVSPAPTGQPAPTSTPESSPVAPVDPSPTATVPTGSGGQASPLTPGATVSHTVIRGEWMLQIARCYGIAYEALQSANRVPVPDLIMPGTVLTIPNIGSQGRIIGPPCVIAYTVVAGDTWESLAQRYATTTAILQRANPGALSVGRSIWTPRAP
jgi:LysM repeat protein